MPWDSGLLRGSPCEGAGELAETSVAAAPESMGVAATSIKKQVAAIAACRKERCRNLFKCDMRSSISLQRAGLFSKAILLLPGNRRSALTTRGTSRYESAEPPKCNTTVAAGLAI